MTGGRSICWCLTMIVLSLSLPDASPVAEEPPLVHRGTVCDFLATREMVFEGRITDIRTHPRPIEGCGDSVGKHCRLLQVAFAVSRVHVGFLEQDTLTVTTPIELEFPGQIQHVGARALVWGYRKSSDRWRIWGSYAIALPNGDLVMHAGAGGANQKYPMHPRTMAHVRRCLAAKRSVRGANAFVGKKAIAMVRIRHVVALRPELHDYACDHLEWVAGPASSTTPPVTRLLVDVLPACFPGIQPGDTLVVPLDVRDRSATQYRVHACIEGFRVREGYVPALGVRHDQLSRVLVETKKGFRLKRLH